MVLVALIVGLQVLHMSLLNQLESKKNVHRKSAGNQRLLELYSAMRDVIHAAPQRLDPSGQYNIIHGILGDGYSSTDSVTSGATLVSQCSVNHIHHIAHLSKRWPGPVAVAVFVSAPELERRVAVAIELLLWLHQCVPSMRRNVTIHLVTPLDTTPLRLPEQPPSPATADVTTCSNVAERVHHELTAGHNYAIAASSAGASVFSSVRYPGNTLRNVALSTVRTSHVFVVDIDMLPNADLYDGFMRFLQEPSLPVPPPALSPDQQPDPVNCVYVVPAFEIQPNLALPQDKEHLLSLWGEDKVRPFYADVCAKCQQPTDYMKWRELHGSQQPAAGSGVKVAIGYTLEWKDPWEPFFIAPRNMPLYDERFKQYGFNRISQVSHLANYFLPDLIVSYSELLNNMTVWLEV